MIGMKVNAQCILVSNGCPLLTAHLELGGLCDIVISGETPFTMDLVFTYVGYLFCALLHLISSMFRIFHDPCYR
jgi:hypothetical protein